MVSGKREMVRAAATALAEHREVTSLCVLDGKGQVRVRAGTGAGPEVPPEIDRLTREAMRSDAMIGEQIGKTEYAIVSPIHREAACARCHGSQVRLGFISATVSTAATEQRIQAMRDRLLVGGLLLLALTCLTLHIAVSRWIERPLAVLAQRVYAMRGEPVPDAVPARGDEVARLSASFTAMMAEIGEKTEALLNAERDLLQSQRLGSIGLTAAGIAHEIGSPLTAIQLQAGFWAEHADGGARAAAMAVKEAAARIGRLQHELLTFDRREALAVTVRDLAELVRGCLSAPELMGLEVVFDPGEAPLPVAMDRALLARALGNVLTNAVQAMGGAGTLAVTVCDAGARRAEITIADTGPGLPETDLPHIFEPFFSRKGSDGGSGLGLAVAREIIVRHGGEITAENGPRGARVHIRLPLAKEEQHGLDPDC